LDDGGNLRQVQTLNVGDDESVVLVLFEFANPCDEPIAPQRLDVLMAGANGTLDLNIGAFPSIINPGGTGYYVAAVDSSLYPGSAPAPALTVPAQDGYNWEDLVEIARQLTVDANGNDANTPEFDPGSVVTGGGGYQWSVIAHTDGPPPAWPPILWLQGECDDGSLGIGQFFPDEYGYNAGGETLFEGHTGWLNCEPDEPLILGPSIDPLWLESALGGPQNSVVLDNVSWEPSEDGLTYQLAANVANTNSVPGRPASYNFSLTGPGVSPFSFSVPGTEVWFPGILGAVVIANIPGDAGDYTAVTANATGTVSVPDEPVAGWPLPPTYVFSDGAAVEPYVNLVPVPNTAQLKLSAEGAVVQQRFWWREGESVRFLESSPPVPVSDLKPFGAFTHRVTSVVIGPASPSLRDGIRAGVYEVRETLSLSRAE